jgi:hypothetical protein
MAFILKATLSTELVKLETDLELLPYSPLLHLHLVIFEINNHSLIQKFLEKFTNSSRE